MGVRAALLAAALAAAAAAVALWLALQRPPSPSPVTYNETLAREGFELFRGLGCISCHSIRSLGVSGGAAGPDLSRALTAPQGPLARFYRENGLQNPASDPVRAAQLLARFLDSPPPYAPTMVVQSNAYRVSGDWPVQLAALVELLKKASAS